jgi:uncharacterized phage protein (TIGR01671 family)
MTRALNFRVWHKPSLTMHHYLKAKFGPKGINVTLSGKFKDVEDVTTLTVPNKDLVIMQFTGLVDRQGKDIYEGDVVSWHERKTAVVTWLTSGCWGTSEGSPLGRSAGLCRVIGDIYSNPELVPTDAGHTETRS